MIWPFKRKREPEPEAPPVETTFVRLARQRPCLGKGRCKLEQRYWSGLPVWQCDACQFETFVEEEAARFTR
jgi:hypothetical protein